MLTAIDVARQLADALEEAGITYAVGGAMPWATTPHRVQQSMWTSTCSFHHALTSTGR